FRHSGLDALGGRGVDLRRGRGRAQQDPARRGQQGAAGGREQRESPPPPAHVNLPGREHVPRAPQLRLGARARHSALFTSTCTACNPSRVLSFWRKATTRRFFSSTSGSLPGNFSSFSAAQVSRYFLRSFFNWSRSTVTDCLAALSFTETPVTPPGMSRTTWR